MGTAELVPHWDLSRWRRGGEDGQAHTLDHPIHCAREQAPGGPQFPVLFSLFHVLYHLNQCDKLIQCLDYFTAVWSGTFCKASDSNWRLSLESTLQGMIFLQLCFVLYCLIMEQKRVCQKLNQLIHSCTILLIQMKWFSIFVISTIHNVASKRALQRNLHAHPGFVSISHRPKRWGKMQQETSLMESHKYKKNALIS